MKDATVLEVSYEVANKVGGIYTVLVSKMSYALDNVSSYYTVGPYYAEKAKKEFSEEKPPAQLASIFSRLEAEHGIKCFYGRWKVEGSPRAILVEPGRLRQKADEVKFSLWKEYGVDSWGVDDWFNEPVLWSRAVGMMLQEMEKSGFLKGDTIVHFHEWLSGAGLLHLKSGKSPLPCVFTTHSTVLGRTIAETGREDLYQIINKGTASPKDKAYEYGVQAKHMLEKAMAEKCDVFTTVSETTANECEYILGRRPDVVLSNGLDMRKFPGKENAAAMHKACSVRMKTFLLGYFLPSYEIDVDNALVCFISGRQEIRNKGIDIFIEALGRLNARMKKDGVKTTLFVFVWVPADTKGKKPTVVEHLELMDDAEKLIQMETEKIEADVMKSFIHGNRQKGSLKLDEGFRKRLSALWKLLREHGGENPPISPFNIDAGNAIARMLSENGLRNAKADKVKIIYYPDYVSENDGLLGMKYYSAIAGCDIGVFPSYYESWGYTPLEAAALGLHSVTTDLSGFGKFIAPFLKPAEKSIMVVKRDGVQDDDAVEELESLLFSLCTMTPEESAKNRNRAKDLSELADWSKLFSNYLKAYELALSSSKSSA
jgi:glycogen synthase